MPLHAQEEEDNQEKESSRLGKKVENGNPSTLLVGMGNGTGTLDNHLAVPQKVKHRVTI